MDFLIQFLKFFCDTYLSLVILMIFVPCKIELQFLDKNKLKSHNSQSNFKNQLGNKSYL